MTNLNSKNDLWPDGLEPDVFIGFSNAFLQQVCTPNVDKHVEKKHKFRLPRIFWPSELYGHGKCYRHWLNWPVWAPIPVYDDHGPPANLVFSNHEKTNKARIHLTSWKQRAEFNTGVNREIIHIEYPWVTYRKSKGYKQKDCRKGTLIFYPHSNDGIELMEYDWDDYFAKLKQLPNSFHPFVICLHRHDVVKQYHNALRKYNLPIITVGDSLSPYFVDRFYSLISNFRYATSNTGGSEVFLCEEFGVNFFIFGERPTYYNYSDPEVPTGVRSGPDSYFDWPEYMKRKHFKCLPDENTLEKNLVTAAVLGLGASTEQVRNRLKLLMIKESIRLSPLIIYMSLSVVVIKLLKYCIAILKK